MNSTGETINNPDSFTEDIGFDKLRHNLAQRRTGTVGVGVPLQ